MTRAALQLYQRLPAPARSWVATARGAYLRWWRYGSATEQLVAQAAERESWSMERWNGWRQDRLACILHDAARHVPYYREHWSERRRRGDHASWELLDNWPILHKEALRQNSRAFLDERCRSRSLFHEHTSGTTGKSLDLWRTRDSVQAWYALCELRARRWYGVSSQERWAILGGQLVAPVRQSRPPFWVWNAAMRQLYMSAYHLSPKFTPYYLDALERFRIDYVLGYPSALHSLALAAQEHGLSRRLRVAIANAEPVLERQRRDIESGFRCPIRETYGLAEVVTAASECPAGTLHLWPEVGHVELLDEDQPAAPGATGELVCTSLLTPEMPLIRYATGDRAILPAVAQACACGRTLPTMGAIEGRCDDVLYTPDGRHIGRLDPIFKAHLPILEAQIIQETLNRIRVLYVPATGFDENAAASIRERLRDRLGPMDVALESVDEIPRGVNGKFRAVVCRLSAQERAQVSAVAKR